jgi:LmbE family N-acetylglucosaminyl deacetylase
VSRSPRHVLAVAAHADDEILGAGGTLAEHVHADDQVRILILSVSAVSRIDENGDAVRTHRTQCVRRVAALYGAEAEIADFPDNGFDTVPRLRITQTIEDAVRRWKPDIVYTHSLADLSLDHRTTAEATSAATRPQPGCRVNTVLAWEIRSATEWGTQTPFKPTWFQPLTRQALAVKEQALRLYASEMRPWPHTRSVRALQAATQLRGAQVGHEAAEAFEVVRHTVAR